MILFLFKKHQRLEKIGKKEGGTYAQFYSV